MKLIFATDFHGNGFAFRALFHAAQENRVDAIVLGGDLSPYPHGGMNGIEMQREFVDSTLAPYLRAFRENASIPIFAIPGNDDCAALETEFRAFDEEGLWHWIPNRAEVLKDGFSVAGMPLVPVTPFVISDYDRVDSPGWSPERCPSNLLLSDSGQLRYVGLEELAKRPSIAEELALLAKKSDPGKTIYVMHSPPYGTDLDLMQGGRPIGSMAIREFIDTHRPPVTFHGHIHESYSRSGAFQEYLGRTLAFNPGPSLDRLRAVIVDIERNNVSFDLQIV